MTINPFDEMLQRFDRLESLVVSISPPAPAAALEKPIDTAELCEFLDVTRPTIERYRKKGIIPFMILGSAIRYDKREVLKALEAKPQKRSK